MRLDQPSGFESREVGLRVDGLVSDHVRQALAEGEFPLVLSGPCNIAATGRSQAPGQKALASSGSTCPSAASAEVEGMFPGELLPELPREELLGPGRFPHPQRDRSQVRLEVELEG